MGETGLFNAGKLDTQLAPYVQAPGFCDGVGAGVGVGVAFGAGVDVELGLGVGVGVATGGGSGVETGVGMGVDAAFRKVHGRCPEVQDTLIEKALANEYQSERARKASAASQSILLSVGRLSCFTVEAPTRRRPTVPRSRH